MAKSKQSPTPSGVYAALATPRKSNSIEIDVSALLDYVDAVVRTGVHGLVLFGWTGEFVHFDLGERIRALTLAIRRSRVPALVNVSHSTIDGALMLAEHAISTGAAGLLLMPPYFYRHTDGQLLQFFETFAQSLRSDTPLYLYNLPSSTAAISVDLALRLFSSGEYNGINDASEDWDFFCSLVELKRRTPFTLMAGNESLFVRAGTAGADGVIAGTAAAIPELAVAIDAAIRFGDMARAQQLFTHLQEFLTWTEKLPPVVAIKRAAVLRGWPLQQTALPPDPQTCADLAALTEWFRVWWPIVLSKCTGKA